MTTILIIDDDEYDLKLYSRLIREASDGYRVLVATNPSDGLKLFEVNSVDCLFLDYHLTETNGVRVMEELQELAHGRLLPVIIFTGAGSQKIQAEVARRGAMDYIVKDIDTNTPEQLDIAIRKVMAWADDLNKNRVRVNQT